MLLKELLLQRCQLGRFRGAHLDRRAAERMLGLLRTEKGKELLRHRLPELGKLLHRGIEGIVRLRHRDWILRGVSAGDLPGETISLWPY